MNVQESLRKAQERALRAKAEVNGSDESGPQGHLWMIYVFIFLVFPWYMYKGSCFRDVCADTVVVGGYLRGSTGVYVSLHIYIYKLYIYMYQFYIIF